jgi:hypothetical protein
MGVRPYDWQFSASVQQEIIPRVSVEVGYNRRAWGNFFFTNNQATPLSAYDLVTITAPLDPKLPGGGGYPVSFYTIKEKFFGATSNYYTSASDLGGGATPTYYWHGVDVDARARMKNGLVFQGGTSTGRGVRDICAVAQNVPSLYDAFGALGGEQVGACKTTEIWLTSFRGLASYIIPKIDVQMSAVIRSQANAQPGFTTDQVATNGGSLTSTYNVTSQQVQRAIGRPLAGGVQTQAVDLLLPGQLYGDRINVVDFRFSKILKFSRTRAVVGLDLYNLFNANTATSYSTGYDPVTWLRPTTVLNPRFVRFNVTVDF